MTQQPVLTEIIQRLPADVLLLGVSTVLALLIAIPMGIYQAVRRNRLSDHLLDGVSDGDVSTVKIDGSG